MFQLAAAKGLIQFTTEELELSWVISCGIHYDGETFGPFSTGALEFCWVILCGIHYDNETFDPTREVDGVVSFLYWIHYDNGTSDIFH